MTARKSFETSASRVEALHSALDDLFLKSQAKILEADDLRPSGLWPSGLRPSGLWPSGLRPSGLRPSGLWSDPLELVRMYSDPRDQEIAAFVAACFALGRVDLLRKAVRTVLDGMGPSPVAYVSDTGPDRMKKQFKNFVYRFFKGDDVAVLLFWIKQILEKYGSLEHLFLEGYRDGDCNISPALSRFARRIIGLKTQPVVSSLPLNSGLRAYLSDPESGSGCKRLSLFLRWVVRTGEPDLGIWKSVTPAKLVIPLDTHVIRLGRKLGLTKRVTPDWKMAMEITESLRRFDPEDPVKYDFVLCHAGMERACPKDGVEAGCEGCVFGMCCLERK